MLKEKLNYKLNGIEHEIITENRIHIDMEPIQDKILIGNKLMLKYVNDLFDYHNIEYCLLNQCLLGQYIFQGIHIYNKTLEIGCLLNHGEKIKKLVDELKQDEFHMEFQENMIKISTHFYNQSKTIIYIYLFHLEEDFLSYETIQKNKMKHPFYDIYPIKKDCFEEFQISVPNKVQNVLSSSGFSLHYIHFTKQKEKSQEIIEKREDHSIYSRFVSYVTPFFS